MPQVWKIAPGEHASAWDMCRERKCIVLGWAQLQDYKRFKNDKEGKEAIVRKLGGGWGNGGGAASSILRFAYEVRPADIVVANRGRSGVVGIGLIDSAYLPPSNPKNPSDSKHYPHARRVDWIINKEIDLERTFFGQSTVTLLKPDRVNEIRRAYVKKYPKLKRVLRDLFGAVLIDERGSIDTRDILESANERLEQEGTFDPENVRDARERTLSMIVQRQGQSAFRSQLLTAYHRKCAITGCPVVELLEAAHILPYKGRETNHSGNGILLRADLHTLFDLYWISIDESTMRVLVSSELNGSDYERYRGKKIQIPTQSGSRPSVGALKHHRRLFESRGDLELAG